jgi:hypothetical protein
VSPITRRTITLVATAEKPGADAAHRAQQHQRRPLHAEGVAPPFAPRLGGGKDQRGEESGQEPDLEHRQRRADAFDARVVGREQRVGEEAEENSLEHVLALSWEPRDLRRARLSPLPPPAR